jgi:hypothetical protein
LVWLIVVAKKEFLPSYLPGGSSELFAAMTFLRFLKVSRVAIIGAGLDSNNDLSSINDLQ